MTESPSRRSALLLCFAHPDDESIFAAGIACAATAEGRPVVLVTGTRGEAGKVGEPPVCPREQLPEVRARELDAAAAIMGVTELRLLGYRDRELATAPPDEVRRVLVATIRRWRPAVVVTFDPHGMNQHADHIAISRFVSDGVAAAADPRWMAEAGKPHTISRLLWVPRRPWDILRAGDPTVSPGVDFVVDIRRWSERKAAALRAHRSQHLTTDRIFFKHDDLELTLGFELFRQGWGPVLRPRPAADIFEGTE